MRIMGKSIGATRVPHVRSWPPRGWSGAGVGVGMLMGVLGFLVSWFVVSCLLGLKVSWFQSFLASTFQRFRKPIRNKFLRNMH